MPAASFESPTLFDDAGAESTGAVAPTELVRVRLVVAYHGGSFHGFAPNQGVPTVGGALVEALTRLLRYPVELTVAGRTDKGVHAWGNVVSFDAPRRGLDLVRMQTALNKMLAPNIAVRSAERVSDEFNARFSATARTYRYLVVNRAVPDPFLVDRAWFVDPPLDLAALRLACDPLIGTHDFTSFCRKPKTVDGSEPSMVRRVIDAHWVDEGEGCLRFEITATAFCHQMVRSIVGLVVEAGMGSRHAGDILAVIRARDRHAAGRLAPPQGLVLWKVAYA